MKILGASLRTWSCVRSEPGKAATRDLQNRDAVREDCASFCTFVLFLFRKKDFSFFAIKNNQFWGSWIITEGVQWTRRACAGVEGGIPANIFRALGMSRSARTSAGRGCFVALLLLSCAGTASGQDRPCNLPETGTLQAGAALSNGYPARIRWEHCFDTATLLCCMLHSFCTLSPPRT